MSREVNDPLAEFDRQLRAELSIAPSPEFEARVRQRIDERAAAPRWRWMPAHTWLAAAATLALATVIGIATLNRRVSDDANFTARTGQDVRLPAPPRASPAPEPRSAHHMARPAATQVRTPHRTEETATASSRREPEVIVPPQQAEAIRRLVHAVAEGRVAAAPEPVETVAGAPQDMEIQPLVVEPVVVPETEKRSGLSSVVRGL